MGLFGELKRFVQRNLAAQPRPWPFVRSDHIVIDATAPIVVAACGDGFPLEELSAQRPKGLCLIAKIRTADDAAAVIRAAATNLSVQRLICTGDDDGSKQPLGSALLALGRGNGVSAGAAATPLNAIAALVDEADLETLRKRIKVIDLLSCGDARKIAARIETEGAAALRSSTGLIARKGETGVEHLTVPSRIRDEGRPDKAGGFRIRLGERSIVVEHLNGKDELLRIIEGETARDLCLALIRNGWVSKLDHAAYLGRELARAELALRRKEPFVQDADAAEAGPSPTQR